MARVTVEDCIQVVENRFELVALASLRAKAISSGSPITIDKDNDKNAVIALREIAAKTVDVSFLKENLIMGLQRKNKFDAYDLDNASLLSKEDVVEIEEDLDNYQLENISGVETMDDEFSENFSFDSENIETDD